MAANGQRVFARLEALGCPTIAAVNGFALGGGCELSCSGLVLAGANAVFGQPEVKLGDSRLRWHPAAHRRSGPAGAGAHAHRPERAQRKPCPVDLHSRWSRRTWSQSKALAAAVAPSSPVAVRLTDGPFSDRQPTLAVASQRGIALRSVLRHRGPAEGMAALEKRAAAFSGRRPQRGG